MEPGLLRQTSIHTHDLVICFIQQAADFAVPLQHVSWNLQESNWLQHMLLQRHIPVCVPKLHDCFS